MKLLFDQNLSFRLCGLLRSVFPESYHVRNAGLTRAGDRDIWDYAAKSGFVLVTLDADFAEMAALLGPPPKIIWLRCGNQPVKAVESLLLEHAATIHAFGSDPAACLEIY